MEEAEYRRAKTSVWWDTENCQVPKGCDAHGIALKLRSELMKMNYSGPLSISAYGNTNLIPNSVQQALASTGIDLYHVPSGKKNASDKKILVDMLLWAMDNPAPANLMLISGDRDYSDALYRLRMRGYNIFLVHPQQASPLLLACANKTWLWASLFPSGCALTQCESSWLVDNGNYFPEFDISSQGSSEHVLSNTSGSGGNKLKGIYVPKASNQLMQQETRREKLRMNCTETGESPLFCNVACKSFKILTMHLLGKDHAAQWEPKQILKLLDEPENMVARPSECHENDVEVTNKMVEAGVETSSYSGFPVHNAFEALFDAKNIEESSQDNNLQSRDSQESMKCLEQQNKELAETCITFESSGREFWKAFKERVESVGGAPLNIDCVFSELSRDFLVPKELIECFDAILKKLEPSTNEIVIEKLEEGMPKQGLEMKSGEPENSLGGPSEHLEENMEEKQKKKKRKKSRVTEDKTEAYVCSICNVICDYPSFLESHLKGRKHAAMIKKHTKALLDDKQMEEEIIQDNGHMEEMIEEIQFQPGEPHEHIECLEKQNNELGEKENKPLPNEECNFIKLNPEFSGPEEAREWLDDMIKKLELYQDATSTQELESIRKKSLEMNSGNPESNYAGTIEHTEEPMKCLEEQNNRELVEISTPSESRGRALRECFESILKKPEPSINEIVREKLEEGIGLEMKSGEPENAAAENVEKDMNDCPTTFESHLKGPKHAIMINKHTEALLDGKQIEEEIIQGNGHLEEMIEEIRFQPGEAHEFIECSENKKKGPGENKEVSNEVCIFTEPNPEFSPPHEHREGVDDIVKKLELSEDATLTLELESIAKQNQEMNSNNPKSKSAGATEYPEEKKKNDEVKKETYVCSICSVICDSPIFFESHLMGRRHAVWAKKHAKKQILFDDKRVLEESLEEKDHPIDAFQEVRFQPEEVQETSNGEVCQISTEGLENESGVQVPDGECFFTKPNPELPEPKLVAWSYIISGN